MEKPRANIRRRTGIFLVVCLALAPGVGSVSAEDLTESLEGEWLFSPIDRQEFAQPQFDDTRWVKVTLPGNLDDVEPVAGRAFWLRTRTNLGRGDSNMALVLGRVWDMDQVYFNGHLIGEQWQERSAVHYNRPRVYTIPQDIIENGENVIAIRMAGAFADQVGLTDGPLEIRRVQDAERALFLDELTNLVYAAIYLITGLFFIILYRRIPEFIEYRWYGFFAITFALQQFLRNEFRFAFGDFFLIYKYLEQVTYLALPTFFFYFFLFLFRIPIERRFHLFAILNGLVGLVMLVWFNPVVWSTIISIWFIVNLPFFGFYIYYTFQAAVRDRKKTAMIVLVGTLFMLGSTLHFYATEHGLLGGKSSFELGALVFNIFLSTALIYRLIRLQLEVAGRQGRLNTVNELRDRIIQYLNTFVRAPAETISGLYRSITAEEADRTGNVRRLRREVDLLQSNLDDILELSRLEVIDDPEYLEQVNFNDFITAVIPRNIITCHIKVNPEIVLNTSLELVNSIVIRLIDFPGFHDFRNIDLIITSDLKSNIHFRFLLYHPDFRKTRKLFELLTSDTPDKTLWVKWAIIREIVRILSGDLKVNILNRKFLRIDIKLPADTSQKNLDMGKPADIKVHYVLPMTIDGVEKPMETMAVPVGAGRPAPAFSTRMSVSDFVELVKHRVSRRK